MLLFKQRDGFSQKEAKSAFGSLCSFRLCWFMDSSDSREELTEYEDVFRKFDRDEQPAYKRPTSRAG